MSAFEVVDTPHGRRDQRARPNIVLCGSAVFVIVGAVAFAIVKSRSNIKSLIDERPVSGEYELTTKALNTSLARSEFTASLAGRRVLHVKGFGSGFKDSISGQFESLAVQQEKEAVRAMINFCPDYLVVDGDPWGDGFQKHIKSFKIAHRGGEGCDVLPQLIWAKDVILSKDGDGQPRDEKTVIKRINQAETWMKHVNMPVIVYWIDTARIDDNVDQIFGVGTVAKLANGKFDTRGLIKISHGDGHSNPMWVSGMEPGMEEAIKAIETRMEKQYFEKCSFENAAKGNLIYETLDNPQSHVHGVVSFGGGESVVLEFATMYFNSKSSFNKDNAALFPHVRGRTTDPPLPKYEGAVFRSQYTK